MAEYVLGYQRRYTNKSKSMDIKVNKVKTADLLTKSNLPASDYVINPYVGCLHACRYCYACFMKRFSGHEEAWGYFIDVKQCDKPINLKKIEGKSVFMSSVTDCYNPLEKKAFATRAILEQLKHANCELTITTKSSLVLRDIDILKECKNVMVAISINTLDEKFKAEMDRASTIAERINTLKVLHENGIKTVLFMSPIFPEITDFKAIVESTKEYVDEYWFENLNLRGSYKSTIIDYIRATRKHLFDLYVKIYYKGDESYWNSLEKEVSEYCQKKKISHKIFFHHENIRKNT